MSTNSRCWHAGAFLATALIAATVGCGTKPSQPVVDQIREADLNDSATLNPGPRKPDATRPSPPKSVDPLIADLQRGYQAVRERPDNVSARRNLFDVLNRLGYTHDANMQLRWLVQRAPLNRHELVCLSFPVRSWASLSRLASDNALADDIQRAMQLANAQLASSNPRLAIEQIDRFPSNVVLKTPALAALKANALSQTQRWTELQAWMISLPPECQRYPDFWIAAGSLANMNKQFDIARECFLQAIFREPHSITAHYGLLETAEAKEQRDLIDRLKFRIGLLDSISRDVKRLRDSSAPPSDWFVEIANQLLAAGRPLEALAWQELALSKTSNSAAQRSKIPGYKSEILAEYPSGMDIDSIRLEIEPAAEDSIANMLRSLVHESAKTSTTIAPASPTPKLPSADDNKLPYQVPRFVDVGSQIGLDFQYKNAEVPVERQFRIFEALGGGVACLDFDRDGLIDLYFGQAATDPPDGLSEESNGLFRLVDGTFRNVVETANGDDRRYTTGVTAGDWNQDGFADLLIANLGRNQLLINCGDGTFRASDDGSEPEHWNHNANYTCSVAIADVSGDHLPDIVEINYLDDKRVFDAIDKDAAGNAVALPGPLQFDPSHDRVIITSPNGNLTAKILGGEIDERPNTGLAVLVTDLDGEVGNEVFVANDLMANQLWRLDQTGSALASGTSLAVASGIALGNSGKPNACMGIAAADFDGNGRVDLHISNFENEWSNHFLQTRPGSFQDASAPFGIDELSNKMLGFGVQAIDYDNDTHWDLMVGNGHIEDLSSTGSLFAMPTQLLVDRRSHSDERGYRLATVEGDDSYWSGKHFSRAMAKVDFNRDGRMDIVTTDLKSGTRLLKNETPSENSWITVELAGISSERDAIGTRLVARIGDTTVHQVSQTGDGYLSKNEPTIHFGLGQNDTIDRLEIRWPSGLEQVLTDLKGNTRWLIIEGQDAAWNRN